MKKATVSLTVITPVFNGANFIEETVNSILEFAPNTGFEYIVVNDGSTDETLAILKSYGTRIQLISQPNSGESSAVNTGLSAARGDYIVVISADDPVFTSEIFEGVQDFFEAHPEVSAWYPDWQMINEHGELVSVVKPKEFSIENLVGRAICLPGPGTFFRREMAIEIGGRREKWKFVADYDFWLRLSDLGPLCKRNQIVAQWRHHKDSTTSVKAGISMFNERINVIDEFLKARNIRGKLNRMARANTRYHASTIKFSSNSIPARRTILKALIIRRRWVEEMTFVASCQLLVNTKVFLLLDTLNFHPKQIVRKFLRLLQEKN